MHVGWCYLVVGADWYAAECVSEVCGEVEPQTNMLPLFLLLLYCVFPITLQYNDLTFIA